MHVLFIPSWYPRNATDVVGSFFRTQAVALHREGCRTGVIVPELVKATGLSQMLTENPLSMAELDQGVHTHRRRVVYWLPRQSMLRAALYRQSGVALFDAYRRAHGLPDIVHVQGAVLAGTVADAIAQRHGIPYVLLEHSSSYSRGHIQGTIRQLVKRWTRNAAARFAVSSSFAALLERQLDYPAGAWGVIPNSVQDRFLDRSLVPGIGDRFTFIHVSIMDDNKRGDLVVEAFAERFLGRQNIRLTFCGDGPTRSLLEGRARELGVAEQIRFAGLLDREEVVEEIARSDALVLSSGHETFGVALVEGMALGKPVVATRCGGPEDIVTEEVGLLVPTDDVGALAAAMEKLVAERDRFDPERLRAICRERYGSGAVARRWIGVYEEVLEASMSGCGGEA